MFAFNIILGFALLCFQNGSFAQIVSDPSLGNIIGTTQATVNTQRPFAAFKGMPYGQINQRFQPATLVTRLSSPLWYFNASGPQLPCIQPATDTVPNAANAVENCLTLNVFTPNTNRNASLPVIVFIHGGSFYQWSGNMWDGRRLLERDVVLVTINYRLGILGYFCLSNDNAPGNAGLYDQVLALQWVKNYIRSFGGDPSRVTVTGQSAGAASVMWLLDSPLATGLITNAIALSGDDIDPWAIDNTPTVSAVIAAQSVGCMFNLTVLGVPTSTPDYGKILTCMQTAPAQNFNLVYTGAFKSAYMPAPVSQLGFLLLTTPVVSPTSPAISMTTGLQNPVPLIIGTTLNDGSFLVSRIYTQYFASTGLAQNTDYMQSQGIALVLSLLGVVDGGPLGSVSSVISTYLGSAANTGLWSSLVGGFIDIAGAAYFKTGALTTATFHSVYNPNTYLYSFEYFGNQTLYTDIGGNPEYVPRGVAHVDDLMYLFYFGDYHKDEDLAMSLYMVNTWANFATTGNPNLPIPGSNPGNQQWAPFSPLTQNYLKINAFNSAGVNNPTSWVGASNGIKSYTD